MVKNETKDKKVVTTFSMESLLAIPKGEMIEYSTPLPDRQGGLKLVITDTMGVVDGTMTSKKATDPLTHYNDRPFVEMNFMLQGNICQTYDGLLKQHPYKQGYHNILFNPFAMETNKLLHAGTHRIFSAHILPEYMVHLFSGYLPEFAPLAEKINKGQPFVLHAPVNGLNKEFRYFFNTFWDGPVSTGLGKLYFDAKILDLLCRQCELLIGDGPMEMQIPKADLEKVYYAREIMLDNLVDPPSLAELSRLCQLNEFKLKKYFRQVFGYSVFGFVQDERLKTAKRLIYQGEKNISMIAYELGYAHSQHFQRAFKKRFGVTPGSLVRNG